MVSFSQRLENVAKVLAHPAIMIGSDSIGLSEGVGPKHGKPHPEMFLTAAGELGVRPERAVVLEDAVAGVQAAKAGEMGAIGMPAV